MVQLMFGNPQANINQQREQGALINKQVMDLQKQQAGAEQGRRKTPGLSREREQLLFESALQQAGQRYATAGQTPDISQYLRALQSAPGSINRVYEQTQQALAAPDTSAAQAQIQRGVDAGIAAQMAAARSLGTPAAIRAGAQQAAQIQQQAGLDAAQMQAQEQMALRQMLAGLAGQRDVMASDRALQSAQLELGAQQQAEAQRQAALEAFLGGTQAYAGLGQRGQIAQMQQVLSERQLQSQIDEARRNRQQALLGALLSTAGAVGSAALTPKPA